MRLPRRAWSGACLALVLVATLVAAGAAQPTTKTLASEVVLDRKLDHPTDLAFNPRDGSLWIVNDSRGAGNTTVVVRGLGTAAESVEEFVDTSAHYLLDPTGIAFAPENAEFATSALSGGGPTLWTSVPSEFRGSQESHFDMVHWTEPALGIAAGSDAARREYWVVDGRHGAIDRYFFNEPHVLGGADHSDGRVYRYKQGSLKSFRRLPSHVEFDPTMRAVYIADTGNNRVVRFVAGAVPANARRLFYLSLPERAFAVRGGMLTTVARGLRRPVGLLLKSGQLYVGEHATGRIVVLSLTGRIVQRIETGVGPNALTGLAEGPDGAIYFLDSRRNRVLRLNG